MTMTKLSQDFNFPKKIMVIEDYWVSLIIDRETAIFPREKMPKMKMAKNQFLVVTVTFDYILITF